MFQKTPSMTFFIEHCTWIISFHGESVLYTHNHNDMESMTTVHIHMQKHRRILLFRYGCIYQRLSSVLLHEERVKIISYHTMLTSPPTLGTSRGSISISQHHWRTPTSQHHGRNSNSTDCHWVRQPNCLPTWSKVNSRRTLFQNLKILRIIASGYYVIHTPVSFPIWGLLWQLWLSYSLCSSVNFTQC